MGFGKLSINIEASKYPGMGQTAGENCRVLITRALYYFIRGVPLNYLISNLKDNNFN